MARADAVNPAAPLVQADAASPPGPALLPEAVLVLVVAPDPDPLRDAGGRSLSHLAAGEWVGSEWGEAPAADSDDSIEIRTPPATRQLV